MRDAERRHWPTVDVIVSSATGDSVECNRASDTCRTTN
jgi:hypothetical protein